MSQGKTPIERAPVFFIGHGSPMNAIADNAFTKSLSQMGMIYSSPRAILCISAHWMTEGSWVTHMKQPKTIHDFGGFPPELFAVKYPAPGSPEIADFISETVKVPHIHPDDEMWGLDHGTWSVLRHLYPQANIPVLQLSLNLEQPAQYHFDLGLKLQELRNHGILIVGSGNVVHNLRRIQWEEQAPAYPWALEFDEWIQEKLAQRDFPALVNEFRNTESGILSVPTNEHYFPLLYTLGASDKTDKLHIEFEGIQNASISMRSFSFR